MKFLMRWSENNLGCGGHWEWGGVLSGMSTAGIWELI